MAQCLSDLKFSHKLTDAFLGHQVHLCFHLKYHNVFFNVLFSSYTQLNVTDGINYTCLAVILVF
jgi:hypothetical protein